MKRTRSVPTIRPPRRRLIGARLLGALLLGALALTGCSAAAVPPTGDPKAGDTAAGDTPGITARGVGKVTGTPDVVTVTLGVQTQGPGAKGALDANSEKATALIDMLKGAGVAPADLRTSELSVYPTYGPTGRITGYQVSNMVTATLRDIGAAGGLIDAAGAAVGDAVRVQQLSFTIDDDSSLRAQARADAVRQAQAQARQLAEAAGVRLGPIRSISEVRADAPPIPYTRDAASAASVPAPLEPGTQELGVTVDVVYGIDQ